MQRDGSHSNDPGDRRTQNAKGQPAHPGPTPAAIVKRALAHWQVAAVVMALGALVTAQVVRMRPPAYKSETVIFYREGIQRSALGTTNEGGPDPLRTLGAKLKEMLLSQSNLKLIIDEFHLYPDLLQKRGYSDAVDQFRKKIEFKARTTDTFAISFEGTSREQAQEVTARLAEVLVEGNARIRKEQVKTTTEFLVAEKKRSDEDLEKAETALAKFVAENPEFAGDAASGGRAGTSVRAEQKRAGAEGRDVRRRAPPSAGGSNPAMASIDPALLAARAQAQQEVLAAKRELAERETRFTEQHPDVRSAQARVATAETALKQAESAVAQAQPAGAAPDPAAAPKRPAPRAPETKPRAAPAPSAAKDAALVALETEWQRLNREVTKARQRAADLENRLFKAEMAASSELGGYTAQIAVLDPAFRPAGPSSIPNRTVVLAGFLGSLLLGAALAALRGLFLDDCIFDAADIVELGFAPVLGVVPAPKQKRWWQRG